MGIDLHAIQKTLTLFILAIGAVYVVVFYLTQKAKGRSQRDDNPGAKKKWACYLVYLLLAYGFLFLVLSRTLLSP